MFSGYSSDHFIIRSGRLHMPRVNGRRGVGIAFYTPSKVSADICVSAESSNCTATSAGNLRLSIDSQPDEVG
jgi:hypothetical protein